MVLVGSVVACLLLASAAPVAASARPVPGGFGNLLGRESWSGWYVKPPTTPIAWVIWWAWPHVACGGADRAWHNANVSIRCIAYDFGSGLADPADASFTLSTDVPAGAADADASTGTRTICNAVGNCRTAQPISGIRIDRRPPEIIPFVAPLAGPYVAGSRAYVAFNCTDADSGVWWCPSPTMLNTTLPGLHSMSFQAIDAAGNVATAVIDYTVVAAGSAPMMIFPAPGSLWV